MKKEHIIMAASSIIICAFLLFIGYSIIQKDKGYTTLEADMVESAEIYYKKNNLYLTDGEELKIKDTDLINADLINSMKVKEDKCSGYVIVKKEKKEYHYKAYLKCNNYTTGGNK